jgi:tetratricopeptide (TPR) repeat protein
MQMRATEKALEIDPNYSDARANLANIKFSHWDFRGAEEDYRRVIALSPSDVNAHDGLCGLLFSLLREEEGMRECQTAQELDPVGNHLSEAFYSAGEYDRAIDIVQSMLRSDPSNGVLHHSLFRYYAAKGMYKEASQEIEKTFALFGNSEGAARIHLASVLSGNRTALRQAAAEGEHWIATKQAYIPGNVAGLYAIVGDKDRAFYWLEEEYKNHDTLWSATDIGLEDINATPLFDSLRSDPRYKDLLRRIGLPP